MAPAPAPGSGAGDLIVAAGGQDVLTVDDLHDALDAVPAGEALALRIVRGTEELDVRVAFDLAEAAEEGTA